MSSRYSSIRQTDHVTSNRRVIATRNGRTCHVTSHEITWVDTVTSVKDRGWNVSAIAVRDANNIRVIRLPLHFEEFLFSYTTGTLGIVFAYVLSQPRQPLLLFSVEIFNQLINAATNIFRCFFRRG